MDTEHIPDPLRKLHIEDVAGLYNVNERELHKFHELTISGRQKRKYSIGRARNCDVHLQDKTVSEVHC